MTLVSVVIPTYNREKYIERALRSSLSQTYENIEVLVVDDGSEDNTPRILSNLSDQDRRIKYIRLDTNCGAQHARNVGIQNASGDYIAFLDSDDEWLSDKLYRQMMVISKGESKLGVIYSGVRRVCNNGITYVDEKPRFRGDIYKAALRQWIAAFNTLVVRKDLLLKIGLCDEKIRAYQEWDLCIRLARHTQFEYLEDSTAIYHLHSAGQLSKDLFLSAQGYLDVITSHRIEIVRECGLRTLSNHYVNLGYHYFLAGAIEQAHDYFKLAFKTAPYNPRSVQHMIALKTSPKLYKNLIAIKQRISPGREKGPPRS